MAGKVFFSVTMSLDGFIAPEVDLGLTGGAERMDDPDVQRGMAQWRELQQWIFPQRFFQENLKLGQGGEEGRDNDIVRETFERTGASVMGKLPAGTAPPGPAGPRLGVAAVRPVSA